MIARWIVLALLAAFAAAVATLVLRRPRRELWITLRAIGRACLTGNGVKFLAFLVAAGAGPALMTYLIWNTAYLHERQRDDDVAYLAFGAMALLGLTQLSLHRLLGAKQAIEIEFWKLKAKLSQGGESEP